MMENGQDIREFKFHSRFVQGQFEEFRVGKLHPDPAPSISQVVPADPGDHELGVQEALFEDPREIVADPPSIIIEETREFVPPTSPRKARYLGFEPPGRLLVLTDVRDEEGLLRRTKFDAPRGVLLPHALSFNVREGGNTRRNPFQFNELPDERLSLGGGSEVPELVLVHQPLFLQGLSQLMHLDRVDFILSSQGIEESPHGNARDQEGPASRIQDRFEGPHEVAVDLRDLGDLLGSPLHDVPPQRVGPRRRRVLTAR
jgi:hypothetical protein